MPHYAEGSKSWTQIRKKKKFRKSTWSQSMTRKKQQRQVNILHILEGVVLEKEQQYSWDTSFQIPQALEKKKKRQQELAWKI